MCCVCDENNNNKYGLYTTYLRIRFLIKGVHKNAITMKIHMSTITKVSSPGDLVKFQVFFSISLLMFSIDVV